MACLEYRRWLPSVRSGAGNVRFDGLSADYKRRLWLVIAINAAMFGTEMAAGHLAGSQALKADALDFLGDTLTYGASLAVIGQGLRLRAGVALVKAVSLAAMGLWAVFVLARPVAAVMGGIGVLALVANLASVLLVMRYKDGDATVRSVWLCSRNDAIGNVAVIGAAGLVLVTKTAWPDLIVAGLLAGLFLNSARLILVQALGEWRSGAGSGLHAGHAPH